MDNTPKSKHDGQKSLTIWAPEDLITKLDDHLDKLAAQHAPGRFSRQGWVLALVRRELAAVGAQPAAEAVRS